MLEVNNFVVEQVGKGQITNMFCQDRTKDFRYEYKISVLNKTTKEKITFDYFDSVYNFENGVKEADLKNALYCFYMDIMSFEYNNDVFDFMDEYGYESKSKAEKVFNACKKQAEKAEKIDFRLEDFEEYFQDY